MPQNVEGDATEPDTLAEEEELTFLTFENDAGETVLIAFTDEDAALAWEPEGLSYIGLRGVDLLLIAAENEIAELLINPASRSVFRLHQDEIAAVSRGEFAQTTIDERQAAPAGMTVLIAPPEEAPPESWREAFNEVLRNYPSVESAFFFDLHIAPTGARPVVGLVLYEKMSRQAQDRLMSTMVAEFEELLPKGQTLDFVVLDEDDFRKTVEDTVAPIYRRPSG